MVHGPVTNFLRRMKQKKSVNKNEEDGYVPPKPAHHWQRRKRMEEKMDKIKQEEVTQNKIDPWFQLCSSPGTRRAVALLPFQGEPQADELEVDQGDPLRIESLDRSESWCQAVNLKTGKSGYIPWDYISEEWGINDVLDAWHEIERRESEAKLSMPGLPQGTYLLRPSSSMFSTKFPSKAILINLSIRTQNLTIIICVIFP